MIALGIDPGLATVGYGIVRVGKRGRHEAVDWGTITTSKQKALPARLAIIENDLNKLIAKYKPSVAVVESIFFATNSKTAITVAQARGVILLTLHRHRITILELTPLQVKSRITNSGSADKGQMQRMIKRLLNLPSVPKPDDAADALALAFCSPTKL